MKKLAARDFEDLLQVEFSPYTQILYLTIFSVWLPSLRACYQNTITGLYLTSFSSEEAACGRKKAATTAKKPQNKTGQTPASQNKTKAHWFKKHLFNLNTYKLHSLSDYVKAIKHFGTTDNTSTQTVGVHFIRL